MKLYEAIAQTQCAIRNCLKTGNREWQIRHVETLKRLMERMPHGSGFDNGTKLIEASDERIVFLTDFHHMDANGFYRGWTHHKVTLKPSFLHGYTMVISGPNYQGIKDYIDDTFRECLNADTTVGDYSHA